MFCCKVNAILKRLFFTPSILVVLPLLIFLHSCNPVNPSFGSPDKIKTINNETPTTTQNSTGPTGGSPPNFTDSYDNDGNDIAITWSAFNSSSLSNHELKLYDSGATSWDNANKPTF